MTPERFNEIQKLCDSKKTGQALDMLRELLLHIKETVTDRGRKGGNARAAALTAEKRSEIARMGGKARHKIKNSTCVQS